jgi:uridine kinase
MAAFLIAITGGSGSGKTTLAGELSARLGEARCALITEDNYYLPRDRHTPPVVGWSNEAVEKTIDFDNPATKDMALFRSHLEALKRGEAIEQPVYSFAAHERVAGAVHRVEPRDVVIVEGVHVLADPGFAPLFDLTVYVDTSADLRLIRRIRRDTDPKGRNRPLERVVDQYIRFVRPSHQRFTEPAKYVCDLVVADEGAPAWRNALPDAEAVERLVAPVWSRLKAMGVA